MTTEVTTKPAEDLLRRIRGEYLEMPGLSVTWQQAQRLWSLDAETCRLVLDALIDAGFLRRTEADCYVRRTDGMPTGPLRMAKAADGPAAARRFAS